MHNSISWSLVAFYVENWKEGFYMSLALSAINQIVVMFLIIIVGVIAFKVKLIDTETNKKLAELVLMLVNPFVIFVSYQRDFNARLLTGLLISLLMAVVTHLVSILVAMVVLRRSKKEGDLAIERFAIIYSNCGFIGIPLVNGVLGSEGVFYITAFMTIFNLTVWTHGFISMSGKSDGKTIIKAILSPSVIATVLGFLLFVARIQLPTVAVEAMTFIGNMNTPLAMLVAGVTIAQTNILKALGKLRIYYITAFKLLLIPIAMLLVFRLFPIDRVVLLTSVLAAACPTAATINLFSLRYDKNYRYAAELFAVATLFSMATIPVVMTIADMIIP